MRRYFESLRPSDVSAIHSVPDGIFLVRVDRAQYRWHKQKPYYEIRFAVLKPRHLTGCFMTGRLYCTPRAMWKLSWFLRDFGYDAELLGKNEIDDKALIDLWGVVKVSEVTVHGISLLNFDGFAPAGRWEELSVFTEAISVGRRCLRDLQLYPDQPVPVLPAPLQASLPRRLERERHPGGHAVWAGL